jgi:hypothetical protein
VHVTALHHQALVTVEGTLSTQLRKHEGLHMLILRCYEGVTRVLQGITAPQA